jgi:enoyl-CoA hydratase/carnithine racemase
VKKEKRVARTNANETLFFCQIAAVICILHGISLGLAIDLSCAADVRICSKDTRFAVKEVDIGMAADIGTLSRLPKAVSNFSWVKDVCLTARDFDAAEALAVGFVSQVHESKAAALDAGLKMAKLIATKSPVGVQGTKELLNHGRDHSVDDSKFFSLSLSLSCSSSSSRVIKLTFRKRPEVHFCLEFCRSSNYRYASGFAFGDTKEEAHF